MSKERTEAILKASMTAVTATASSRGNRLAMRPHHVADPRPDGQLELVFQR
ncbi:hypothetical protein [Salinibacterium sp.]|uniref:hypothetical protein n=1 Tax=Salinibacterium sp. TaxID=1915057 RepID=UPI00286A1E78|nr:hypothetical protein [Salinibacterium sp.]